MIKCEYGNSISNSQEPEEWTPNREELPFLNNGYLWTKTTFIYNGVDAGNYKTATYWGYQKTETAVLEVEGSVLSFEVASFDAETLSVAVNEPENNVVVFTYTYVDQKG